MNDRQLISWMVNNLLTDNQLDAVPPGETKSLRHFGRPEIYFNFNNVQSVYIGEARLCKCGCSGRHYYPSADKDKGAEIRGYRLEPEEISDAMIRRVINRISKGEFNEIHSYGSDIYSAFYGNREWTVYLKTPDQRLQNELKKLANYSEM